MNKQPVSYLQTDPRWSNIDYSAAGEKTTIGASGCGPTSMAMVLATWADPTVTPKTECAWALHHNPSYKAPNQGTYYSYFVPAAERYGLTCKRLNTANIHGNSKSSYHDQAKAEVLKGNLVIACMGKGLWTRSGHYVLVWWIEGSTIYINDPASTKAARTRGDYSLFRQQVKYYWVIERPAGKEVEDLTEAETRKIVQEEMSKQATAIAEQVNAALSEPVYNSIEEVPEDWARPTIQKLMDKGALKGDGPGLNLKYSLVRALVVLDRMGAFD